MRDLKKYILLFFITIFIITLLSSNFYADELNNFNISIDVTSPTSAHVIENLTISYDNLNINNFKEEITEAGADIDKLMKINNTLKPHIYLNDYKNVSVTFDELNNIVRIEYDTYDLCLIKYLENDKEILWKLNENLFRFFILNNLYYIPKDSSISVTLYEPLILQDPVPETNIVNRTIKWKGVSSNELRLLSLEKKPPKPSFVFSSLFDNTNLKTSLIYLFVLLFIIVFLLFFIKKISKSIKSFVIKHSKIEPKKQKKDIIFDYDFFRK